jgi:hypothetical protein
VVELKGGVSACRQMVKARESSRFGIDVREEARGAVDCKVMQWGLWRGRGWIGGTESEIQDRNPKGEVRIIGGGWAALAMNDNQFRVLKCLPQRIHAQWRAQSAMGDGETA